MNIQFYDSNDVENPCDVDEIIFFELTKSGLMAYHKHEIVFKTNIYISALECSLPTHFIRANEEVIINRNYIKEALAYADGKIVIVMENANNTSFIVSKHYIDNVKINVVVK